LGNGQTGPGQRQQEENCQIGPVQVDEFFHGCQRAGEFSAHTSQTTPSAKAGRQTSGAAGSSMRSKSPAGRRCCAAPSGKKDSSTSSPSCCSTSAVQCSTQSPVLMYVAAAVVLIPGA